MLIALPLAWMLTFVNRVYTIYFPSTILREAHQQAYDHLRKTDKLFRSLSPKLLTIYFKRFIQLVAILTPLSYLFAMYCTGILTGEGIDPFEKVCFFILSTLFVLEITFTILYFYKYKKEDDKIQDMKDHMQDYIEKELAKNPEESRDNLMSIFIDVHKNHRDEVVSNMMLYSNITLGIRLSELIIIACLFYAVITWTISFLS